MAGFAFIYFMKDSPELIPETVPTHVNYWKELSPLHYKGGPFSDRSGGLILFDAADDTSAKEIISKDPFIIKDLLKNYWLKEWIAE